MRAQLALMLGALERLEAETAARRARAEWREALMAAALLGGAAPEAPRPRGFWQRLRGPR